tara:strand:- start:52 stop:258 length:207 start_codon:yes stop_codon:yes gene_type:complete
LARLGLARQLRQGGVRQGAAGQGKAVAAWFGVVRHVMARQGKAGQGKAVTARMAGLGQARRGTAGHGS